MVFLCKIRADFSLLETFFVIVALNPSIFARYLATPCGVQLRIYIIARKPMRVNELEAKVNLLNKVILLVAATKVVFICC